MWVFYLISLPLTVGMVGVTLWYFMGPDVARYVRFTVGYTWFCSLSIVILVPADIWTVRFLSSSSCLDFATMIMCCGSCDVGLSGSGSLFRSFDFFIRLSPSE
ncbi:hypothetical protein Sango_0926000 [Sesamum angolense]|uniref:Uncharacterized protein n=1 Tax=Sesamum angolense TaxID=2727404 RepID=A0AAE2BXY8_9LAMI|nr:hypothetical protein Sango_0926000 [Sesamum angolense]